MTAFQIIRETLYICWEVNENLYSRIISSFLKISQIRDGWMKIGIVPSIKVLNIHISCFLTLWSWSWTFTF
jgi:hypothetical protein